MANDFMYKFEIIENIVKNLDFKSKNEVIKLAKKMSEIAQDNDNYTLEIKKAFLDAYNEIKSDELTLNNLLEIKKLLS